MGRCSNKSVSPCGLKVRPHMQRSVCTQASHPCSHSELKIPDNFNSWFAISLLHVWMVLYKTREDLV